MPRGCSAGGARGWLVLLALAAGALPARSQPVLQAAAGLAEMSLEQLGELPVTSVSGRPESLRSAAASVFVISGEDIRRSAATTLPEALRLAPNLQVARLNAGQYAISARGFDNALANKLLVLVDGRTVYSTLFAGVFWDTQDVVLEDIERIEVISGPGGTLWGANAVNGVINIITKPAAATQGGLVSVTRSDSGGTEALRWGGKLGEAGHLRLYALGLDRNNTQRADGVERPDASSKEQVGFRSDLALEAGQLTLQGDAYRGGKLPASNLAPRLHGGNLLARWEGRFAGGSPYRLQAYYDEQARDETASFRNDAQTFDLQFTHEPQVPPGQQLLWGAGYRVGRDTNDPSPVLVFIPADRRLSWANVFAQHQLQAGAWQLTIGAKVERNSYTGVEFLPNLRVAYNQASATTWGALSRAVRAPARIDRDFNFPATAPFQIRGGGDNFVSEVATVLELGNKGQWGRNLSYSGTVFRQRFERLRGGSGSPPQVANRIEGDVDGIEAWGQWQPLEAARLSLGYLGLRKDLRFSAPPADANGIASLGNDPRSQWSLRAQFDLPYRLELDVAARRVGALPAPAVPAYSAVDVRLGWQATPRIELSLLAKNILDDRHAEFNAAAVASEFGRRIFLRAVFQL